jgi:hypothetical protein
MFPFGYHFILIMKSTFLTKVNKSDRSQKWSDHELVSQKSQQTGLP